MDQWETTRALNRLLACAMGAEQEAKSCLAEIRALAARPLSEADREAIATAVIDRIGRHLAESGMLATTAILTREEAKAYSKHRSDAAFSAWCRRWWIRPHKRGRYSRAQLDLALSREARLRG